MGDLPESLAGRTAFLLRLATARAEEMGEAALRDEGISGREYGVLELLAHRSPRSQIDLGRELHVDRTTGASLLAGLEARGLVRRTVDPANRRANLVTLTAAGEALRARASDVLAACDDRFQARLSGEERAAMRRMLRSLLDEGVGG
ncbi:MarR family winged helix-turn-helix transcriptional regulator [Actinomycetospora atypica]|uniref:MarR family winged helix-turn-helix transcriptional regulator n=1 Tax=Actinomycetospora atypica TaxID=1290095 RepID=A0ABV9YVD1_9PSEU